MRRGCCVRVVRKSLADEVTCEQRPEGGSPVEDIWRRVFTLKGTAKATVLGQELAWGDRGPVERPVWLQWREQGGESWR